MMPGKQSRNITLISVHGPLQQQRLGAAQPEPEVPSSMQRMARIPGQDRKPDKAWRGNCRLSATMRSAKRVEHLF